MLTAIRKFSNTIYAKIILGIMIIPFVLWGMGGAFRGGSKNTIATINKQKITTIEYVNYIRNSKINFKIMDKEEKLKIFNELLTNFIGEEVMTLEAKSLGIKKRMLVIHHGAIHGNMIKRPGESLMDFFVLKYWSTDFVAVSRATRNTLIQNRYFDTNINPIRVRESLKIFSIAILSKLVISPVSKVRFETNFPVCLLSIILVSACIKDLTISF